MRSASSARIVSIRTITKLRLPVGLVAAVTSMALVASGCSTSVASDSIGDNAVGWNPQTLAPIPVDTNSGQGAQTPLYANSVVTDKQGLAVSLQPTLSVPDAPPNQQYTFQIFTVGGPNSTMLWHKPAGTNSVKVTPTPGQSEVLTQGGEYLWQAVAGVGGKTYGPYAMSVDVVRAGKQPTKNVGPFSVNLASGSLTYSPNLRTVQGPSGGLGVSLSYAPDANPTPGVPAGWVLQGTNQGWSHVQTYNGGVVALVSAGGTMAAFAPTGGTSADGSTAYTAVAPPGRPAPTGGDATLVKNSDNTWTATMTTGQVAIFSAAGSDGVGYLASTYNGTTTSPNYTLTNGAITAVTDPIVNDDPDFAVKLTYQSSGADCPTADGFVDAPDGMLCKIDYPDGSSTNFLYLTIPGTTTPVLARIVDHPQTTDGKPDVTDIGYDMAGRIISLREPAASNALAAGNAGAPNGRTDDDQMREVIHYDDHSTQPSWRVTSITKPAASAGGQQPTYTFNYQTGQTTMNLVCNTADPSCPTPTAGFNQQVTYDLNTLLPLTNTNSKNQTITTKWNTSQDQRLSDSDFSRRTTQYSYDDLGNLVKNTGPFSTNSGSAPSDAPYTKYTYDQDLSGCVNQQACVVKDMQGFNVTYWSNADLTGMPAGHTFGPVVSGTTPPQTVDWVWPSPPIGGSGGFGARFTGMITIPAAPSGSKTSKSDPAPTSFKTAMNGAAVTGESLWIDGIACTPSCAIPLSPGTYPIRMDLSVPDWQQAQPVGLQWALPSGGWQAIPMTAIAPNYGLASVTGQNDAFNPTQANAESDVYSNYADPASKQVTQSWAQAMPEIMGQTDYEAFDPTNPTDPQIGRTTQTIAPSKSTTTFTYYQPGEDVPDVSCPDDLGLGSQHEMPKLVTRDDVQYQAYYNAMGQIAASSIAGSPTYCVYYGDDGDVAKKIIPSRGDLPQTTSTYQKFVGGDPFALQLNVDKGDQSYIVSTETNLYGQVVSSTDQWGTKQAFTYNPYTGQQLTVTTTVATGKTSTTTSTYSQDGDLTTVAVDGQTVATVSQPDYGKQTTSTVTYGNKVSEVITLNDFGQFQSETWTTSDKKQFSLTDSMSPAGRVLSEAYAFPSSTPGDNPVATFNYSYDAIGRLTQACVVGSPKCAAGAATSLKLAHSSWQYGYDANTNRTSQTIDDQQFSYQYDSNDRLTNTSDPAFAGGISYGDGTWGEISQLGPLTLDYDGGSFVSTVTDHSTGQQISYNRIGSNLIGKTLTAPDGSSTEIRYTAGGFILDKAGNPQWQVINLPGGTTLIKNVAGNQAGSEQWQHNTIRDQHMWTSNSAGTESDPADRQLYSPFGEALLGASTSVNSPTTKAGNPATGTPSPTATTAPSQTATSTPAPGASTDVPAPNYQWQAGNGLQTDQFTNAAGTSTISLIDSGARMYVPALGRFTAPDPQLGGSVNAYDYANQNPINKADPTGNMASWVKLLISTVVAVICVAATLLFGQAEVSAVGDMIDARVGTDAAFEMVSAQKFLPLRVAGYQLGGLLGGVVLPLPGIIGNKYQNVQLWVDLAITGAAALLSAGLAARMLLIGRAAANQAMTQALLGADDAISDAGSVADSVASEDLDPAITGSREVGNTAGANNAAGGQVAHPQPGLNGAQQPPPPPAAGNAFGHPAQGWNAAQ